MTNTESLPTQYLDRPGGRIAFDVAGPADGHLVVCIPGMGDLRSTFRHLRPELVKAGHRVATMDLRGHGDSDASFDAYDDEAAASDAVALIEHLGGPAVLVGNSMGAGAAVIAAAQRPDLVTSQVLIGPFVRAVELPALMRWAFRLAMAGPWSTRVWLAYLPTLYPSRRGEDFQQHRAEIAAALRRPGRARAFRRTTRTDHTPAWEAARRVRIPTLVVMGSKDPDFPDPAAEAELAARTLGGTVLMVDGAGHYPQSEFAELTGPAVVQFLAGATHRA
ncbi:MAG TPA: alpha/beta hydrolase [Nakamurella sp.]|nr:alpha/beta hydrolase [Nakamurella sp.]